MNVTTRFLRFKTVGRNVSIQEEGSKEIILQHADITDLLDALVTHMEECSCRTCCEYLFDLRGKCHD